MPKGKQGGKRTIAVLARERSEYTPYKIQTQWNESDARKEYSRLRNVVVKRLKRIREKTPNAIIFEKYTPEYFKKLPDIKNFRELSHLLSDVAHALQSKEASLHAISEVEKKARNTLFKNFGVEIKTHEEFVNFARFMQLAREWSSDRIYDSERLVEIFDENRGESKTKLLRVYKKWVKGREKKTRSFKNRRG